MDTLLTILTIISTLSTGVATFAWRQTIVALQQAQQHAQQQADRMDSLLRDSMQQTNDKLQVAERHARDAESYSREAGQHAAVAEGHMSNAKLVVESYRPSNAPLPKVSLSAEERRDLIKEQNTPEMKERTDAMTAVMRTPHWNSQWQRGKTSNNEPVKK